MAAGEAQPIASEGATPVARQPDVDTAALAVLIARLFPGGGWQAERTAAGVSTPVYRVWRDDDTRYLRLAESAAASLAPEARAHGLLRALGVRVPAVLHFEAHDAALGRSAMVTTAIIGTPLAALPLGEATPAVVRDAGRDLARFNRVPVAGFGWLRRDGASADELSGEHASRRAWVLAHLEGDLAAARARGLSVAEAAAARALIEADLAAGDDERAYLAHGDFDVTHIFAEDGRYTGIIDLGELRGAEPLYDLAHFCLHDGETLPARLLPGLLAGYGDVTPLPADVAARLRVLAPRIALRALGARGGRPFDGYGRWLLGRARELLAEAGASA